MRALMLQTSYSTELFPQFNLNININISINININFNVICMKTTGSQKVALS